MIYLNLKENQLSLLLQATYLLQILQMIFAERHMKEQEIVFKKNSFLNIE